MKINDFVKIKPRTWKGNFKLETLTIVISQLITLYFHVINLYLQKSPIQMK